MKRTVRTLCAFLSAAMLAPSQALAADTVTEAQTQKPSIVINEVESDANGDVSGKLIDQNTSSAFETARYPNAVAGGVLTIGSINCSYSDAEKPDPGEPTDPSKPADAPKPGDSTEEPTSPSEKPTGSSKNVTKPTEKQTNAPKTGDHSILWIWAVLAVLSVGTCFAVILIRPCRRH